MDITTLGKDMLPQIISFGGNIIGAVVWLVAGRRIIKWIAKKSKSSISRYISDPSIRGFVQSFLSISLKVILLVSVATLLGLQTTSIVAALGAMGLAIGLALQGSLSNVAGGLLIVMFKPFTVGDFIQAQEVSGTVQEITILYTTLTTTHNQKVVIPNGNLANNVITNHSTHQNKMIEYTLQIPSDREFHTIKNIIQECLDTTTTIDKSRDTVIGLKNIVGSYSEIRVRFRTSSNLYLSNYHSVLEKIKEKLEAEKMSLQLIPQVEKEESLIS